MATHVVVIDSSFRRTTVKVNPGTFLTDVVDEACKKFNLNASNYGLKNNNKPVDISRTFRQTGLTSGAKLELVAASRTPTAISVALQLPEALVEGVPGGRLTDKVASNTTFWKLLRHFEENKGLNLNFTARGVTEITNGSSGAGRIYYEMPVLITMGRELSSFGDLQKTLAQLGLSGGSCLIRLTFKKTDQPLEEAMNEIGRYFKEEENPSSTDQTTTDAPKKEADPITTAIASLPSVGTKSPEESEDVSMSTDERIPTTVTSSTQIVPDTVTEPMLDINERPVSVFSPPSGDTPQAALRPHNEDDYEPTIAHAKLHQSRLLNSTMNKRLLSDAEAERVEKERAAKLAATTEVSIKIRFPDQTSIVSTFKASETGTDLYTFVTKAIVAEDQPYKLVWNNNGTQIVPRDDKKLLVKHLGLGGRVLVNFQWEDSVDMKVRQEPALKPHLRENAQAVKVPEIVAVEGKEDDRTPTVIDKGKEKESTGSGGGKAKGVPKWFKGLGKK